MVGPAAGHLQFHPAQRPTISASNSRLDTAISYILVRIIALIYIFNYSRCGIFRARVIQRGVEKRSRPRSGFHCEQSA